jgi:hypothetical protein
MFATQQTSFSLQQNNGALFPVQQQQQTASPFMQQSNPTAQVSVNVNDPFNLAPNNLANTLPNNGIGNLNAGKSTRPVYEGIVFTLFKGYNSTPLFNTINNHGQTQQFSSAPNTPFQAPATSNPFSQMNTTYTTPTATAISNQPGNSILPFMNQSFNNNNMVTNPWSTNPSF